MALAIMVLFQKVIMIDMIEKMISVVTPCYNSGTFVHRLLDSILMQDYPLVEMICIDDGSTDNTHEVINSYVGKFANKGYSLVYVYQENAGQASAVNCGIKLAHGEYLAWPDSDDYYTRKDAMSRMINKLSSLDSSFGAVKCIGTYVDSVTFEDMKWKFEWDMHENLFEACLLGRGFQIVPVNYIVRIKAFDHVNPKREIFTGRYPQNLQMFLPLLYTYKCFTMSDSFCNIVVRNNSHSHQKQDYSKVIDTFEGYLDILNHTLDSIKEMGNNERMKYKFMCKVDITAKCLEFSMLYNKRNEALHYVKQIKEMGQKINKGKKIKLQLMRWPWLYKYVLTLQNRNIE